MMIAIAILVSAVISLGISMYFHGIEKDNTIIIQPNVPIEFLNKSIVINYREEFHHFKYENYDKSTDETLTVEVTV